MGCLGKLLVELLLWEANVVPGLTKTCLGVVLVEGGGVFIVPFIHVGGIFDGRDGQVRARHSETEFEDIPVIRS